jgi:hypothetical protein
VAIERGELDSLREVYKQAVERWVSAIRAEEALATPDHSIRAWERWEKAGFDAEGAGKRATEAKEAYIEGLRKADYSF